MAVYVDDMFKYRIGRYRDMRMSHLIADDHHELMAMAAALKLKPAWIQHPGTHKEHFDIPEYKRDESIRLGAVAVSMREVVIIVRRKRNGG